MLLVMAFFSLFEIKKIETMYQGTAQIKLSLNQLVYPNPAYYFDYYPTELLAVDSAEKSAVIRVYFPDKGWRQFTARELLPIDDSGYFLDSVTADNITLTYAIAGKVLPGEYKLLYRW